MDGTRIKKLVLKIVELKLFKNNVWLLHEKNIKNYIKYGQPKKGQNWSKKGHILHSFCTKLLCPETSDDEH